MVGASSVAENETDGRIRKRMQRKECSVAEVCTPDRTLGRGGGGSERKKQKYWKWWASLDLDSFWKGDRKTVTSFVMIMSLWNICMTWKKQWNDISYGRGNQEDNGRRGKKWKGMRSASNWITHRDEWSPLVISTFLSLASSSSILPSPSVMNVCALSCPFSSDDTLYETTISKRSNELKMCLDSLFKLWRLQRCNINVRKKGAHHRLNRRGKWFRSNDKTELCRW